MPYDKLLDVNFFNELAFDTDKTRINVSVWGYDGKEKKIQITRENIVDREWSFTKLGRMNKQEIESVLPIIIKAVEVM